MSVIKNMENKEQENNKEYEWENFNPIFTFGEHDIEDDSEIKKEENIKESI